jgi:hypothetical protein
LQIADCRLKIENRFHSICNLTSAITSNYGALRNRTAAIAAQPDLFADSAGNLSFRHSQRTAHPSL